MTLTGRNLNNLQRTNDEIKKSGYKVDTQLVVADVVKEADCKALIDNAITKFGRLDILVNSAGILSRGTIENTSLADFDEIMNINVRSVFLLTQLTIPHLKKTKGKIVNVSSVTGLRAVS